MKNKKRVIAERKYNTHLVEHEEASTPLPTRRKPVWTRVLLVHTARRAGEDEAAAKLTLHMLTVATPLLHHLPQLLLNLFFSIPIIIYLLSTRYLVYSHMIHMQKLNSPYTPPRSVARGPSSV